jgi:type VI secretion system secreted protein VgrG
VNLSDILNAFSDMVLSAEHRVLRLRFLANGAQELEDGLLVQAIDIHERLNDGIDGHVNCVSVRADLPLEMLRSLPVEIQLDNDTGGTRCIRAVVASVRRGTSANHCGLTPYQLHVVDPLRFLLGRQMETYQVRDRSVVGMTSELLDVLFQDVPSLGALLQVRWALAREEAYPVRAMWLQNSECTTSYLTREWRRAGISWLFQPMSDSDKIELLLFDWPGALRESPAEGVDFNRSDVPMQRGTVLACCEARQLTTGVLKIGSWDYRAARLETSQCSTLDVIDGSWSSDLLASLQQVRLERPHDGDSFEEMNRIAQVRMGRAEFESLWFTGISSQSELKVGHYMTLRGLPSDPGASPRALREARLGFVNNQYTIVDLRHVGHSNLQTLSDLMGRLLRDSERLDGWVPLPELDGMHGDGEHAYLNAFTAVVHGTPLVPRWNPDEHQLRPRPLKGIVAGRPGSTVDMDDEGRFQVTIIGERTGRLTPRLRNDAVNAGHRQGALLPLRVGMEVDLGFDGGDQNRLFIDRVSYNGANPPPVFYEGGSSVSGNAAQAGIRLHEFGGSRYGELMFDSTPNQISVSLGSEHARSRLQLGDLRGNRREGEAPAIGEGAYLHTLASLALRAAQVLLLSTFGRDDSSAWQLDMAEHAAAIEAANDLADTLAKYATENQGKAMDAEARAQLAEYVAKAAAGTNVDPNGTDGGQPTLNLTALAGIAATTLQSILLFAQTNLDATAVKNVQLTSGEHTVLNARKSMGLFAAEGGLTAIAHQGELLLQSQHGGTRVESAGDITIAAGGDVRIDGKNVLIRNEAGTFVRLSDLLELGSNGPLQAKTGGHQWRGPSTDPAKLPSFGPPKPPEVCIECLLNAVNSALPVAII